MLYSVICNVEMLLMY